jgi:fructose-1,6-bisphosphatase
MSRYCVVFDPLDGSSNIDCGVSIGTVSCLILKHDIVLFFKFKYLTDKMKSDCCYRITGYCSYILNAFSFI